MVNIALDRALGALQGLALGDALGMPTQSMSPAEVDKYYGRIEGLCDSVSEQPIAPSMAAGTITDDTEQALLVAALLISGHGHIEPMAFAEALLDWEERMIAKGSFDLLGPSTKAALDKVRAGEDPRTTGRFGTTNGAAMRVTPAGIACDVANFAEFSNRIYETCMVTHDTVQGWQGAMLVASAISAGINGKDTVEAIDNALYQVSSASPHGHWSAKASVVARSKAALCGADGLAEKELIRFIREDVGTSVDSTESIPAALAIAYSHSANPTKGLLMAANLGGDTDTIGAITGAILGATVGTVAFPVENVAKIESVSDLNLAKVAKQLLVLRGQRP